MPEQKLPKLKREQSALVTLRCPGIITAGFSCPGIITAEFSSVNLAPSSSLCKFRFCNPDDSSL